MSKYQVIFYSSVSNSRYSYFVKVNSVDPDRYDEADQALHNVWTTHIDKLNIDIGEINVRKLK